MQVKLTEERIQQMEKELGVEQVRANDKFNELFHLLSAARCGLSLPKKSLYEPQGPDQSDHDYRLEAKSETGIKCRDCLKVFTGNIREFIEHECNPRLIPYFENKILPKINK